MKPAYKKLEFGSFAEIEVYKAFSSLIGSDETKNEKPVSVL